MLMRRIGVVLILAFAIFAVPLTVRSAETWEKLYEAKTYKDAKEQKLPYRLLTPAKIEPSKRYPLVLFLHGLGERGTDNAAQLKHGAGEFAKTENRRKYPCFRRGPAMSVQQRLGPWKVERPAGTATIRCPRSPRNP